MLGRQMLPLLAPAAIGLVILTSTLTVGSTRGHGLGESPAHAIRGVAIVDLASTPAAQATLSLTAVATATITLGTSTSTAVSTATSLSGTTSPSATPSSVETRSTTSTATVAVPTASPVGPAVATSTATPTSHVPRPAWSIRSVDTMKMSRDTLRDQLSNAQIEAVVHLDEKLHVSHVTVDVYYDDPVYMGRWVQAIRAAHLHVWFRSHWYAWENHREAQGDLTPDEYIANTRRFLQQHVDLVRNGDIFDFCPEPENGNYWGDHFGSGWSWRNSAAKAAFNTFVRSGVYMAQSTLANRGRGDVLVTAISMNASIATRLVSKPTVRRLGMLTLDLYPEDTTTDPATATNRLLAELRAVHSHWNVPILIGEHGYSRDMPVSDGTQANVLAAEFEALERTSFVVGFNYWVDAGGARYGGYTNLYAMQRNRWVPRAAAAVVSKAYSAMT